MNMIYIGILDTSGICLSDSRVISKIPEEVRGRVEKTRDSEQGALRAGAYMLLSEIYKRCFDEKMPRIIYTGGGKPVFESSNNENKALHNAPKFSISHDGSISAVVMTDDGFDVGIDVQTTSKRSIDYNKIEKRFFSQIPDLQNTVCIESLYGDLNINNVCVKIVYYAYRNGELFQVPCVVFLSQNENDENEEMQFLAKWTVLESALKASGEGFGGISLVKNIIKDISSQTISFVRNKRKYLLSISIMPTKQEPG